MWSVPERLECEVLQKVRYINTLTFTFFYLYWYPVFPHLRFQFHKKTLGPTTTSWGHKADVQCTVLSPLIIHFNHGYIIRIRKKDQVVDILTHVAESDTQRNKLVLAVRQLRLSSQRSLPRACMTGNSDRRDDEDITEPRQRRQDDPNINNNILAGINV